MPRRHGPALLYVDSSGRTHQVDREAVPDERERALFRALADRADTLADKADEQPKPTPQTGQYL